MADDDKDADAIERDIERTQDAIGDTVGRIEDKLNPRELTRSILGDNGQEIAREALRMIRQNPVPAAMIAIGAVWILAASDSPLIGRIGDRLARSLRGEEGEGSLRSRSDEPAPIGPPPAIGEAYDRRTGAT